MDVHQAQQALFDLLVWHMAFPFPSEGLDAVDEAAFMRGITLLTLEPSPYLHCELDSYDASPSLQNLHSETWGPHEGDIIEKRRRGPHDYRRRLFRSLAIPIPADTHLDASQTGNVATIPVMCFYYHDDAGREVVVNRDEDERRVDVQDVLTDVPADWTPGVLHPSRVVYAKAASLLPGYEHHLHELCVPRGKLAALLGFLDARGALLNGNVGDEADADRDIKEARRSALGRLVADLVAEEDAPAYIGWKRFNELISDEMTVREINHNEFEAGALTSDVRLTLPNVCQISSLLSRQRQRRQVEPNDTVSAPHLCALLLMCRILRDFTSNTSILSRWRATCI